eukprot:jgi/Bigna1/67308/fgenesh1_pg.3_\
MEVVFGYIGTGYIGVQFQNGDNTGGARTVSDDLEDSLYQWGGIKQVNYRPFRMTSDRAFNYSIKWNYASRTDKGVHATANIIGTKLLVDPSELEANAGVDLQWLHLSQSSIDEMNQYLNSSRIRVFDAYRVAQGANARKWAESRMYRYLIPSEYINGDIKGLERVLSKFIGTHRFCNFAGKIARVDTNNKKRKDYTKAKNEREQKFLDIAHELDDPEWRVIHAQKRKEPRFSRTILDIRVEARRLAEQDFAEVTLVGRSFVMHQIRKIIGGAMSVVRGDLPEEVLDISLKSVFQVGERGKGKGGGSGGEDNATEVSSQKQRDTTIDLDLVDAIGDHQASWGAHTNNTTAVATNNSNKMLKNDDVGAMLILDSVNPREIRAFVEETRKTEKDDGGGASDSQQASSQGSIAASAAVLRTKRAAKPTDGRWDIQKDDQVARRARNAAESFRDSIILPHAAEIATNPSIWEEFAKEVSMMKDRHGDYDRLMMKQRKWEAYQEEMFQMRRDAGMVGLKEKHALEKNEREEARLQNKEKRAARRTYFRGLRMMNKGKIKEEGSKVHHDGASISTSQDSVSSSQQGAGGTTADHPHTTSSESTRTKRLQEGSFDDEYSSLASTCSS